jgi:hypothetical protein
MTEAQKLGAPFFFATDEPPTAAAIDDDIYLTVTTRGPGISRKGRGDRYHSYRRIRQGDHRPAFDRPHRVAPRQGVLIGFTRLRPPSRA